MNRLTLTLPIAALASVATVAPSFAQDWHERAMTSNPSARESSASALDPVNGDVIIFGGTNPTGTLDDTQRFDGYRWSPVTQTTPSPGGRSDFDMALDQGRGEIVLFGGRGTFAASLGDTWEFNGTTWSEVLPAVSPSARYGQAMAYDPGTGQVILFGGNTSAGSLADTWAFDGTTWTNLMPVVSPPAREGHAMAFDHNLGQIVMYGGTAVGFGWYSDTWALDLTANTWVPVTPATASPAAREAHAMTFDESRSTLVMSGGAIMGAGAASDVWEWNGASWSTLSSSVAPTGRRDHVLEYGPLGELATFGGFAGSSQGDTWTLRSVIPFGSNIPIRIDQSVPACPSQTGGFLPTLTSDTGAIIGTPLVLDMEGFDPAFPVTALSFGFAPQTPVPCTSLSHVSAVTTSLLMNQGAGTFSLTVPNDPSLAGGSMFVQAGSIDPSGSSLYFTNQGIVVIGF